jgi:hypothetical protein
MKKIYKLFLDISFFSLFPFSLFQNSSFAVSYNGLGNLTDGANSIAFHSQNNVYVTGFSAGNGTGNDYVTLIK